MTEQADKMHDSKNGGLSAEGRKKFKQKDGSQLKPGVKNYSSASLADKKRWISWASRFAGNPQPLKKDNGEPTNYALMFQAWGEKIPTSSADVKAVYNKAQSRKKALGMGESASDQAALAEAAAADPADKKLWAEVVAEAKKRFSTYPSFYANAWVTNTYKKRGGKFNGKKDGGDKPAFLKSAAIKMLAAVTDQRNGQIVGDYVWVEQADRWQGIGRFFPLLPMVSHEDIARYRAAGPTDDFDADGDNDTLPVDGQIVTPEDQTKLAALRDSHQKSQTAAKALLDASHPLAVAIGADADAFISTQLDSIDRLIDPDEDFEEPRDYSDTMREEQASVSVDHRAPKELTHPSGSWTSAAPGSFGTITINGQPYYLNQQLTSGTESGGQVVIHNTVSANEMRAKVTEQMDRLKVKKPTDLEAANVPRARAFVTQAHGRTVVTGPAAAFTGGWQKALSANEHMLWIQGRLVGGETPNRNGALWTAGDLEMGQPTVAHGPLNWLHEARHVIGSIADSKFLPGQAEGSPKSPERAGSTRDPHIIAAAGIWNWLYPDEAMVVQQASDLGQLWYSMECISKDVICSGANGCGHTMDYMSFAREEPGACIHMQERAKGGTTLRFAEPTFLGAAVIVPPTRPGWADADASVMAEAASLSEKAFEQTGKPDIPASVFEQMVAQVVKYTQM